MRASSFIVDRPISESAKAASPPWGAGCAVSYLLSLETRLRRVGTLVRARGSFDGCPRYLLVLFAELGHQRDAAALRAEQPDAGYPMASDDCTRGCITSCGEDD